MIAHFSYVSLNLLYVVLSTSFFRILFSYVSFFFIVWFFFFIKLVIENLIYSHNIIFSLVKDWCYLWLHIDNFLWQFSFYLFYIYYFYWFFSFRVSEYNIYIIVFIYWNEVWLIQYNEIRARYKSKVVCFLIYNIY